MTEPYQTNLDDGLFRRNLSLALLIILNRLAYNDQSCLTEILERVLPEKLEKLLFERRLFEIMVEMIRTQGHVDIPRVRQLILSDFPTGYLANLELLLSYKPTPEQVKRAIELLLSPPPPESPKSIKWRQQVKAFEAMTCSEQQAYLEQNWKALLEIQQYVLMSFMVRQDCLQVVPYLMRHLKSDDPFMRFNTLWSLGMLGCREHRQVFIDSYLNDPDEEVKGDSLVYLSYTFRGERDAEIIGMALEAFDNPSNSIMLRLAAAAAMYHQLNPDESSPPFPWYEKEEEIFQHPVLVETVAETRRLLNGQLGTKAEADVE